MPKQNELTNLLKTRVNYINLSSTFLNRTRCKFCLEIPSIYFFIRSKFYHADISENIKRSDLLKKTYKRICTDDYLHLDPSSNNGISFFTFVIPFKGFSPALYRTKGINSIMDFAECAYCECGRSSWVFYYKFAKDRPEIINKKSYNFYTKKFIRY